MSPEPRHEGDYGSRQVVAARRVLVDLGQVLASFRDAIVIVGGWVPDLLLRDALNPHIGSMDVDVALDAARLGDGRYAQLLKVLLDTRRYQLGRERFQLSTVVDLGDGEAPVRVDVEFLAPADVKLKKNNPKLVEGFRVLQFPACAVAFHDPQSVEVDGTTTSGAANTVRLSVASLPDFVVMKAHAIGLRDKPKDVYDLCYCLDEFPGGREAIGGDWRSRRGEPLVEASIAILTEKFRTVEQYGPQQLAVFHESASPSDGLMHARRAFELVQKLLSLL